MWQSVAGYIAPQPVSLNPFIPTVPTCAVRETNVSRHNGGTSGAPLKPLRVDSALRNVIGGINRPFLSS